MRGSSRRSRRDIGVGRRCHRCRCCSGGHHAIGFFFFSVVSSSSYLLRRSYLRLLRTRMRVTRIDVDVVVVDVLALVSFVMTRMLGSTWTMSVVNAVSRLTMLSDYKTRLVMVE